ncbi:7427_t:CDS:2, partial [Funneliformis mosseae]
MFHLPPSEILSARDYIDIMDDISNLGIVNHLDNFERKNTPTIVVFGDQSCGKSSLMQRFTGGLPVPIGTSLCTRAPFEIHMIQSGEPIRKITLRYIEDKNHRPMTSREVEFADLTNSYKSEFEKKLRDAQRYVLNPSIKDIKSRLPEPNNDELSFTKNAVCLTIGGPAQNYNFSLVDLPGFVRNVELNESFIMSLVEEYIKRDSAILVPIFQATADISTQCALRLACDADPDGLRTVCALTKIDRIMDYPNDDDKHLELAELVKSKGEYQCTNGVYIIRNRSSIEPEDSDDALENETIKELKKHKAWKDVPINMFGLQNLVMKLMELQEQCHKRSWPRIQPHLEDCRDDFEKRLNNLPHRSNENPIIRFSELIGIFDKSFTSHANAENVDHKLYRGQQSNFGQFDQTLLKTRPIYILSFDGGETNAEIFDPIKPGALQWRKEFSAEDWKEFDFDEYASDSKYLWTMDQLYEVVQDQQGGQLVGYFPYKAVVSIREDRNNESTKQVLEDIEKLDLATEAQQSNASMSVMFILRNTIKEHAFLAATGALAYWKMSHSKFREIVPRIVEYYLVHQFAIR